MASFPIIHVITANIDDAFVTEHITRAGGQMASVNQLLSYMGRLGEEERAHLSTRILAYIEKRVEPVEDAIEQIWAFIAGDQQVLNRLATTEAGLRETYPVTARTAEAARLRRDRRGIAYESCTDAWGHDIAKHLKDYGFFNRENTAKIIQALAKREKNWSDVAKELNRLVLHRVFHEKGKGVSNKPYPTAVDIKNAGLTHKKFPEYSMAEASKDADRHDWHRVLSLSLYGIAEMPDKQVEDIAFTPTVPHTRAPTPTSSRSKSRLGSGSRPGTASGTPSGIALARPSKTGGITAGTLPPALLARLGLSTSTPVVTGSPPGGTPGWAASPLGRFAPRHPSGDLGVSSPLRYGLSTEEIPTLSPLGSPSLAGTVKKIRSGPSHFGTDPYASPSSRSRAGSLSGDLIMSPPSGRTGRSGSMGLSTFVHDMSTGLLSSPGDVSGSVYEPGSPTPKGRETATDDDDVTSPVSTLAPASCTCDKTRVSEALLAAINKGSGVEEEQLRILAEFEGCLPAGQETTDTTTYCFWHIKMMGAVVGLRLKFMNRSQVLIALQKVHQNVNEIKSLKTSKETAHLFRKTNRPGIPSDNLGPYRYFPQAPKTIRLMDSDMAYRLVQAAMMDQSDKIEDFKKAWKDKGTVNLRLFDWLVNDPDIKKIIDEEYEMYQWHLREINGNPNYGWLRNMCYGVIQQVVRQYPGYWMLYVGLRPDHCAWLVSYPYYAKFTHKGDQTTFKHVDLNINRLVDEGRGAEQIQGSLSLDYEAGNDATILVPGMHHHLKDWRDRLKSRPDPRRAKEFPKVSMLKDGYVTAITKGMLTDDDLKRYKSEWKSVPCQPGDVRVTMPHIPHGAKGPADGKRRTILPWYVALREDHHRLEVIEGGTYDQLRTAHADLEAPPLTPSGLANKYGKIPYAFPASIQLEGNGCISDALVGRKRWDSAEVQIWLHQFCEKSRSLNNIKNWLKNWQKTAIENVKTTWKTSMVAERRAFGKRSYFYCKEHKLSHPGPDHEDPREADAEEETEKTLDIEADPLHLESGEGLRGEEKGAGSK